MTDQPNSHAESFNDRITQAVENIVRPLHRVLENEIASLVNEFATIVAGERTTALAAARDAAAAEKEVAVSDAMAAAAAEKEAAVQDAVAAAKVEHDLSVAELRETMAAERETALKDAHATSEAAATIPIAAAVERALADARAEHESSLAGAKEAMAAEREAALKDAHATSEAATTIAIAAAVERAVSDAKAEAATALEAARSAATRERDERIAETEARAAGDLHAAVTETLASERQADLAAVERLLGTIRTIDGSRSVSQVLDALGGHALIETGRLAVFLVRDGKLWGWYLRGFGEADGKARDVELPLDEAGVIAGAVRGHQCAASSDPDLRAANVPGPPPGSLLAVPEGRAGFAAPVCVGGEVVAVVYADEGSAAEPPVPSTWPELIEITVRHASRCLELLMAARIAAWTRGVAGEAATSQAADEAAARPRSTEDDDAARRYARLLISEIKLYHESDVNQGKRERDLLQRLKPEIERARRLFEERVAPDVRGRTECFEQELVRTLADGNASLLGQAT